MLGVWLSFKFIQALNQTSLFLTNQKYYVTSIVLSGIVTAITRTLILIEEHLIEFPRPISVVIEYAHNLADSVVLNMVVQLMIFVDCFYSTVQPFDIGKNRTVCICVLLWVLSLTHQKLSEYGLPPGLVSIAFMGFLNLICWLAVIGLILIGRFKYKHQAVGEIKEKYRIVVLLRTLTVLKPLAILSALRNFILDGIILLLLLEVIPGNTVVGFCYDYTVAFYSIFSPIVMIKSHDELKKIFGFCKQVEDNTSTKATVTNDDKFVPKNVVGEFLRVPNDGDHHFKQIASNWNTMAVQRNSTFRNVTVIDLFTSPFQCEILGIRGQCSRWKRSKKRLSKMQPFHLALACLLGSSICQPSLAQYNNRRNNGYGQQAAPDPTMFSQWPKQITQTWPTPVQNELKPIRGPDILVGSQILDQIDRFSSLDQLAMTLQTASPPLANFLSQEIIGVKNAMNQLKMKATLNTQIFVNELQKIGQEFLTNSSAEFKNLDPATQAELKNAYPTLSKYLGSPISQNLLFGESVPPIGAPSILPTQYASKQNLDLQQKMLKQQQQQNGYQNPYGSNMGYNNGMNYGNNRRYG
uniref:G_PROTEIN_RECEP_F1_2 domain-containing protein n=1 Tax=Bursaphelenchus xylophilus TaxID=6326 RepID=A0A1I7RYW8_BURXY